jgi:hypothetical protein
VGVCHGKANERLRSGQETGARVGKGWRVIGRELLGVKTKAITYQSGQLRQMKDARKLVGLLEKTKEVGTVTIEVGQGEAVFGPIGDKPGRALARGLASLANVRHFRVHNTPEASYGFLTTSNTQFVNE